MAHLGYFFTVKKIDQCVQNCLKFNSGKFEIFSHLMNRKCGLLKFFEADYIFGHKNAKND